MNQKPTHKSIFMLEEGTHLDTVCSRDGTGCSRAGWTIKQGKSVAGGMKRGGDTIKVCRYCWSFNITESQIYRMTTDGEAEDS